MKIGKLSNEDLQHLVLDRLPGQANTVSYGPSIGLDCAAVRFGDGQVILSCDPITGAAADIGYLAVHISCNDIAACGIRPSVLMLVIIAPPQCTPDEIRLVADQASAAAKALNVSIVGGHTEISDAVTRFVITTTALGFTYGGGIIQANGGQAGDYLLMTKTAGLEGTAIFAADQTDKLSGLLTADELATAAAMIGQISVVEEGACGGNFGVHAMHDATEGGILGACWELAEASKRGCIVEKELIPIDPLTRRICSCLNVNPLRLISSGSLIMATADPEPLIAELNRKGIRCSIIGRLTEEPARLLKTGTVLSELRPPEPDELYKIH
ncbi:MAG: AIR synthase family protein [Clostridiaceae bacterium]|nr:AIR synthase family protein [Clostridiaceae bacterium]